VTTPDLQPTERIPTLEAAETQYEEPRRGGGAFTFLGRLVLLVVVAIGALLAAALLLTPPAESILILGSDARPDEVRRGQVGRTDTLLLLVADRATPRLAMVGIPRDLWVSIPGHGQERINVAYQAGGSSTAKQTVSNVLGQRVDRYLVIGLQGVREVVDALGGIDINVPQAIRDDQYPTDDYGVISINIPAGPQHMDGETALQYARTRHQDSDFGRIGRQQQVLGAVRSALMNPVNWPRLPAVALAMQRTVSTDMSPLDMVAVAAAVLRNPGEPDRLVLDGTYVTPAVGEAGAAILEPRSNLRAEVASFLGGSSSSASIEVLNGAGVPGLARTTADRLSRRGFLIASVGDADRTQPQTTIQVRSAARRAAEDVASTLGLPNSRITEVGNLPAADVRVILGSDAR
jgi:polyisoprenyl-teichoic acid--peptidoglycan teichoic acid transferase